MSGLATGFESAKSALRALRHNMLRSFLTLLGIVIGVASVITMLAIGDGAKKQIVDAVTAMGANLLNVNPGASNNNRGNTIGFREPHARGRHCANTEVKNVMAVRAVPGGARTIRTRTVTCVRKSLAPLKNICRGKRSVVGHILHQPGRRRICAGGSDRPTVADVLFLMARIRSANTSCWIP